MAVFRMRGTEAIGVNLKIDSDDIGLCIFQTLHTRCTPLWSMNI
jgi:hypothetical protein